MKKIRLALFGVLFSFVMYGQNQTVNGELTVEGKTTISTNSDAILSLLNTDNSSQYIQYLQSNVRKAYLGLDASNNFVLAKENGGNFYFSGGNVGIGTSTISGVLHLKGNSLANDVLLKMELDGNRSWEFQQNGAGAGTGLKLKSTANKAFTLTSSDFFLFDPSDETYGLRFVPGNNTNKGGKILAGSTFDHSLELTNTGSGGYNLFVDGNVGIGTNTPEDKMVVQVTNARRYVKFKAPNGEERVQFYVGGTGNPAQLAMYAADGTSRNVQIATAGVSYFNGGNVGIGTSAPDAKLAVNGKIHAKEVKVDLTGWPDYVFAKGYDLLSVEEVATFIKKNGHLPKMPSATTVEKEGVLLGEMNKKLLEKIEELTLYIIEQEKKLKKQEEKNKGLEFRLAKLELSLLNEPSQK